MNHVQHLRLRASAAQVLVAAGAAEDDATGADDAFGAATGSTFSPIISSSSLIQSSSSCVRSPCGSNSRPSM